MFVGVGVGVVWVWVWARVWNGVAWCGAGRRGGGAVR